jgi:hypothetical protein
VHYVSSKLPGKGGQTDLGGLKILEGYKLETCHLATSPSDKNKFSVSYSGTCEATVRFDPDTDSEEVIPGLDVSYRAHEWKHVQCMDEAYTWAQKKLETVGKWCCCNYDRAKAAAGEIAKTARFMRTTCSAKVDCVDYSKATSTDIRNQAETECNAYNKYKTDLETKMLMIDKLLREGCK